MELPLLIAVLSLVIAIIVAIRCSIVKREGCKLIVGMGSVYRFCI